MKTELVVVPLTATVIKGSVRLCTFRNCSGYGSWIVEFPHLWGTEKRSYEHFAKHSAAMSEYREHDRKVRERAAQS